MENLERQCLEKLDKILSKFDLKIDIINLTALKVCQYRLVDNVSDEADWKAEWLGLWLSLNDLLLHQQSIFKCLKPYHDYMTDKFLSLHASSKIIKIYQRYSEAHQFIQPLKSNCLEEFLIKCDLIGI